MILIQINEKEIKMFSELDAVLGMLISYDSDNRIVFASSDVKKEFLYDDMTGINMKNIFPTVFIDGRSDEEINKILHEERYINAYRKNNTCFPALIRMMETDSGIRIVRIYDMQPEVGWKQRYEEAEIEMHKALSGQNEFVANITHELRTPVNGIKGHVAFLKEQGGLTEEQLRTLNIVSKCCENMEKIINNLLDFAKMDAGKLTIENEMFVFRDMMEQVYQTNVKQANQKGINLNMSIAETIPQHLYGDPLRIGQILNNFISNAVKFTSVGSVRVEVVDVARKGNSIELFFMVIDTGIGIAKENLDKLFKSFSQVDGSITRNYGGTGLGLAISRQLVSMMNGSVEVRSEKGKGSTFAFSIVLKTEETEENILETEQPEDNGEDNQEEQNRTESLQDRFDTIINKIEREDVTEAFVWGTSENIHEIRDTLGKIMLCIEMGNWEKTEMFITKIKKLIAGAGMEAQKLLFKFQLAVRNENHDKALQEYDEIIKYLEEQIKD